MNSLPHKNIKTSQLTKGHNWYPWKFKQSYLITKDYKNVVSEDVSPVGKKM
jgi:hypothetical protein